MKKFTITLLIIFTTVFTFAQTNGVTRTIFITGGNFSKAYVQYVINLTHKPNPRICFIPTASADNANYIDFWYEMAEDLPMKPFVLKLFINSTPGQATFEEKLMGMDAIIVGGGSTLNMMAIWKAQGIDTVLRNAYNKGIIMAGGSAGSICWFAGGPTDSRPQKLSLVDGLGFLPMSHCPHYHNEPMRKPFYTQAVLSGQLKQGYACDNDAGILFQNESLIKTVSLDEKNNVYFVSVENGQIKEQQLPMNEIIKQ